MKVAAHKLNCAAFFIRNTPLWSVSVRAFMDRSRYNYLRLVCSLRSMPPELPPQPTAAPPTGEPRLYEDIRYSHPIPSVEMTFMAREALIYS